MKRIISFLTHDTVVMRIHEKHYITMMKVHHCDLIIINMYCYQNKCNTEFSDSIFWLYHTLFFTEQRQGGVYKKFVKYFWQKPCANWIVQLKITHD